MHQGHTIPQLGHQNSPVPKSQPYDPSLQGFECPDSKSGPKRKKGKNKGNIWQENPNWETDQAYKDGE